MSTIQEKIKKELLKELYTNVDKIYDSLEQKLLLEDSKRDITIRELNKLKDQLYLVVTHSRLS